MLNQNHPDILNYVRQLKANGTFDQFRKECLSEMEAKSEFKTLKSNVETFVQEYLSEQTWNSLLKKSDIRENLRKKISERDILSTEIDSILNDVVDNKIESIFRPIIEKMVNNSLQTESTQNFVSLTAQKSISVDDSNKSPLIKQKISSPIDASIAKKEKTDKPESPIVPIPQMQEKSKVLAQKDQKKPVIRPMKPKPSTVSIVSQKPTLLFEETLKVDPKNEYNFDWKLDFNEFKTHELYEELSVSSVNTSDLSDYEEISFEEKPKEEVAEALPRRPEKLVGSAKRKRTLNPKYYS